MALREDLDLDISQALQSVDQLGTALDDATQVAVVITEVDTSEVTTSIDAAVESADDQVEVTGDATDVTGSIDGAVDAADDQVEITADATDVTGSVDGALEAADDVVEITADAADVTGSITAAVANADTVIVITADSSQVNEELDETKERGEESSRGIVAGFGSIKSAAAATAAVIAVVGVAGFVNAASDLEESGSKVEQVFREATPTIAAFADTAATSVGLASQEALEAAGTFGNLLTALGLGRQAAADASVGVVTLGADLASFNNIPIDDALEKLRSGLVGEIEPLRQLGISFSAVDVEVKAVELGLADASGEVDEAGKVQARLAIITEQTANSQGDFARTSAGLANQTRILSAEFGNAQAAIGQALLPVVLEFVGVLREIIPVVEPIAVTVATAFASLVSAAGPVIDALLPLLDAILVPIGQVLEDLGPVFGTLGDAIATLLGAFLPLFQTLGDLLSTVGEAIAPLIGALANLVSVAIEPIAASLQTALESLEPFIDAIGLVIEVVALAITELLELPIVLGIIEGAALAVGAVLETAGLIIEGIGSALGITSESVDQASEAFDDFKPAIFGAVGSLEEFQTAATTAGESAQDFVAAAVFDNTEIRQFVQGIGLSIEDLTGFLSEGSAGVDELFVALTGIEGADFAQQARRDADGALVLTGAIRATSEEATIFVGEVKTLAAELQTAANVQLFAAQANDLLTESEIQGAIAANTDAEGTINYVGALESLAPQAEAAAVTQDLLAVAEEEAGAEAVVASGAFDQLALQFLAGQIGAESLTDAAQQLGIDVDVAKSFVEQLDGAVKTFVENTLSTLPQVADAFKPVDDATSPRTIRENLQFQLVALTEFRDEVQFLVAAGFADIAAVAAEEGPAAVGALADALRAGNPEILEEIRGLLGGIGTVSGEVATVVRDDLAPQAVLDGQVLAGAINTGFGIEIVDPVTGLPAQAGAAVAQVPAAIEANTPPNEAAAAFSANTTSASYAAAMAALPTAAGAAAAGVPNELTAATPGAEAAADVLGADTATAADEGIQQIPANTAAALEVTRVILEQSIFFLGIVAGLVGRQIGVDFSEGVAQGIIAGISSITAAATAAVVAAELAARIALQADSPSEVLAKVGDDFDKGLARGIDRSGSIVVDSAVAIAEAAGFAVREGLIAPFNIEAEGNTLSAGFLRFLADTVSNLDAPSVATRAPSPLITTATTATTGRVTGATAGGATTIGPIEVNISFGGVPTTEEARSAGAAAADGLSERLKALAQRQAVVDTRIAGA